MLLAVCTVGMSDLFAQFYNGTSQEFGKSRIQYQEFDWTYFNYDRYKVYSYTGGTELAKYVSQRAQGIITELEEQFEYVVEDRLNFIVYNNFAA